MFGFLTVLCSTVALHRMHRLWSNLDDIRSTGELMLFRSVFQGTLVQEVYVHSLNQDERAQISAGQINIQDMKYYTRNEILKNALDIMILRIPQIPISPSICGMCRKKSQIHGGPTPQHIGQMTPQDRFRGLMSVL